MKLNLNQQMGTSVSNLWNILSDTQNRNKWVSFFECANPEALKENLELDTVYTFLSAQKCKERYFRIIPYKEIGLTVESPKGTWTVFVILKENEDNVEMLISADFKSSTWWPSLLSWLEAGKLELNVTELVERFKAYAEAENKYQVTSNK
jgi:hypothetical protein